jgi:hypothetical protein
MDHLPDGLAPKEQAPRADNDDFWMLDFCIIHELVCFLLYDAAYFLGRSAEYERLQAILDEETRQRAINRIARTNAINYAAEEV